MGKRIFDIIFSILGLTVAGGVIAFCYILATIDTRSNGLFTQTRIGQYARPFTILKLKTMQPLTGRISSVGKFLRRYKLDELPQLVNVLLGQMSFVGPRPDIPGYYDLLEAGDRKLLELKPGITSEASLKYKNEDAILSLQQDPLRYNDEIIFPDKVKMNLEYYRDHSLRGDIVILMRTLFQ
jgi:lipopolysaccharide/colanic/teichoic acid biosynthesis glycosyltransferase